MDALIIILRALHIGAGVLWAGWAFCSAGFVVPAVRAMGPAGGAFMQALTTKTRLVQIMSWAPAIVVVTGLLMFWEVSGHFDAAWFASGQGTTLTIGSLAGLSAFTMGFLVMKPTASRIAKLGRTIATAGAPPTPEQAAEMGHLQAKMARGGSIAAWLLAVAVLGMAVTRFVMW
jgi:hypothetical protein